MVRFISLLVLNLLFATDSTRAQTPAAHPPVGRIIVKPKTSIDAAALMQSIREALPEERRIAFFGAISGNAYVLNVVAPATNNDVPKIISLLSATQLFEYVEADAKMTLKRPR